ncbi:MAG: alkylphosphonate utilization protein [Planctomycetes bacterium]|nr:alkylphosphonate utilization protein [Planctomycetota bacterium]
MSEVPPCPACQSPHAWLDRDRFSCPECGHEWVPAPAGAASAEEPAVRVVKDANGNVLQDGDSVTVVKDLDVRGASSKLKAGTKVRNIRLVDGDHDIDCKIDGFGAMQLKSKFVRKVT